MHLSVHLHTESFKEISGIYKSQNFTRDISNGKVENLLPSEISRPKREDSRQNYSNFVKQSLPPTTELNSTHVDIFLKSQKFLSCCRNFEVEKISRILYNFAFFLQFFVSGSAVRTNGSFNVLILKAVSPKGENVCGSCRILEF